MDDFELQRIFHQITATSSPLEALNIYERHFDLLKGWRIIYAANDDHGPFKLQNRVVDSSTGICSIFRGQSLWVIDANMVGTEGVVPYFIQLRLTSKTHWLDTEKKQQRDLCW